MEKTENDLEVLNWKSAFGNRFTIKPSKAMLEDQCVIVRQVNLVGQPREYPPPLRAFSYDREYVLAYISKVLLQSLGVDSKKELDRLMVEAWSYHKHG